MKNFLLALLLVIPLSGCVSSAVRNAIDTAQDHIALKWADEWRPALEEEMDEALVAAKQEMLARTVASIDGLEAKLEGRLETINVRVNDFDENQDGRVSGAETLALLREIKAKNENAPNPLSWWEIMLALGAAYVPTTAAKEALRSKMNGTGTGDGTAGGDTVAA